jgi:hypothetical protein
MIGSSSWAPAFLCCFTEAGAGGDFEGENRGVDVVVGTVDQRRLDAEHREASERTRRHDAFDALLNAGDVFLRDRAADDLGFELEVVAFRVRLEDDLDASELTGTTGLLLVRVILLRALRVIDSR